MDIHHNAALARAALCMAIAVRGGSVRGVIFHTDQGGECTGEIFVQACRSAGVTRSMGRTGSALDNAAAESFNSTLEWELLRDNHFRTREQARRAVAEWIDEYNTERRFPPTGYSARSTTNSCAPSKTARSRRAGTAGRHDEAEASGTATVFAGPRRAEATGPPCGLKGRYRARCATGLRPALDPGASAAPDAQTVPGRARAPCPATPRGAQHQTIKIESLQTKSLRFQGITTVPPTLRRGSRRSR
jgi:hypothetical protein